jgi:hypothetical protein
MLALSIFSTFQIGLLFGRVAFHSHASVITQERISFRLIPHQIFFFQGYTNKFMQ